VDDDDLLFFPRSSEVSEPQTPISPPMTYEPMAPEPPPMHHYQSPEPPMHHFHDPEPSHMDEPAVPVDEAPWPAFSMESEPPIMESESVTMEHEVESEHGSYAEERTRDFEEEDDYMPRRRSDRGDRRGGDRRPMRRGPGRGAGFGRPKPLIQDIFRRGQEVL